MSNITDKITDVRNATRPVSTTVSSPRTAGATSLSCTSLTGWPTASKVHFVTYQIDSNSNPVAGTQLDCRGIVSGSTIGSFAVLDGTDNGNSVGDVVEMLPTASWGQDLADALTSQHGRTGAHTAITATSITTTADATVGGNLAVTGTSGFTGAVTLPSSTVVTASINADAVTAAKLADDSVFPANINSANGSSGSSWAWQAWTPTLSGDFDDTKWTKDCKYIQIGKTVHFRFYITASTTTPMSGSGGAVFTLPVTSVTYPGSAGKHPIATVVIQDASAGDFTGIAWWASTTTATFQDINAGGSFAAPNGFSSTLPMTWTTSDSIYATGTYEAA